MTLSIGQTLWYVNTRSPSYPHGGEAVVTNIGRKWAELNDGRYPRINIETMEADGGKYSSPGRCWLSQLDYDMDTSRTHVWNIFVKRVRDQYYTPKSGITEQAIRDAASLLNITL